MPTPCHVTCAAPGHIRNWLRIFDAKRMGASSIRVTFFPYTQIANHYFGIFLNGALKSIVAASAFEPTVTIVNKDNGDTSAYVYIEDFGLWSYDPSNQISVGAWAKASESTLANRLAYGWETQTSFQQSDGSISTVYGDAQLSSIVVSGMERFTNVEEVPNRPTRGRLTYSIVNNGTTRTVRFWRGSLLVAEGSRVGDGSVTCSAINESGLTITCSITYSADLAPGTAFIHLIWPESYQVHYSQSALSFPRTPEMIAVDIGGDRFAARSAVLTGGTWYAAIVPVRDGVAQSSAITTYTKTVLTIPASPSTFVVTGNAGATNIAWTVGEPGCTFTVYASKMNEAVNFGDYALPAPITTALDATNQNLAAVTGYPGFIYVAVRATKGGNQERKDEITTIEYDSTGAIIAVRPNRASIVGESLNGLTISVEAVVLSSESLVDAAYIQLFVKPLGTDFDFTDPVDTEALSDAIAGFQKATLSYTVSGAGWYHLCVRAASLDGSLSFYYAERYIPLQTTAPGSPSNVTVDVMRGWKGT